MAIYSQIMVAVDLTPDSLLIGQRGRAIAAALGGALWILHVVEPIPPVVPIPPEPMAAAIVTSQAEILDLAQEQIGRLAEELGVPATRCDVVVGDTKAQIVRVAADRRIDLIVIGSHERHGLAFLLKPTEDVVVHEAPCDVLAIRLSEKSPKSKKK
ncbi:MAG: universal stress protein [Steroidobacteraceae bacterium]